LKQVNLKTYPQLPAKVKMDKKKVRSGIRRGAAIFFEFKPELRGEEFEFLRFPIITLQLSSNI